jgi:tetratricopeptide (TPR) repeat protein
LRTYRSDASDVAEVLAAGEYNCVSASVLFVELAKRHGLNAYAVQLPEHVRCEVLIDGVAMPIETTSLNPSAGKFTRKRTRPLGDVTLIATLYYNRGVAAFDQGDLPTAIELNQQAIALDPECRPAKENLLAAINNRVVELMKANAKFEALKLLEHGLGIEPGYRPFQVNRAYLLQRG